MGKYIDLTGHRFGRLTVLRDTKQRSSGGSVMWECQCDCGNIKIISSNSLMRQTSPTRSCGCLMLENHAKAIKQTREKHLEPKRYDGTLLSTIKPERKANSNNSLGYKGVYYNKKQKKYLAQIRCRYKLYHLGYFEKIEDAIKARKQAEEELFQPIIEAYNISNGQAERKYNRCTGCAKSVNKV